MAVIESLGQMLPKMVNVNEGAGGTPTATGSGGGGSAQDGLGQIDTGSGTVRSALNTATSALGGGGGSSVPPALFPYKKGGYVSKGGKLNLGSGRISTATKNKNCSNW
jgi:hypothetical protein